VNDSTDQILEPDLAICDPHHHLFEHPTFGSYLLPDLYADIAIGHNIKATVFVDSHAFYSRRLPPEMASIGEVEFAAGMAAIADSQHYGTTRICAGIVGFADLQQGARVEELLEAQIVAGGGRFSGIRQMAGYDPAVPVDHRVETPPNLYLTSAFREGFASLDKLGLSFDAWVFHTQIDEVTSLARAFPDTPLVLNHMASPLNVGPYAGKHNEVFADWHSGIRRLAEHPNTYVKLGGLGMTTFRGPAPDTSIDGLANTWRPFIETAIEAFGPSRAMFESNYPVDRQTCSYVTIWNVFKRIAANYNPDEKRMLFYDTARKFYRIDI